jgi:hypothetical protein
VKRAVVIVTEADTLSIYEGYANNPDWRPRKPEYIDPEEQLLADLLVMSAECSASDVPHLQNAAARVREWLPREDS